MVFHFGTGNSQLVGSERPLMFVAPIYAWRIPKVVEQWIRATRFEGNQNAYFVLTRGGTQGNAAVYAAKLCAETGLIYRGLASAQMPENYIALSAAPSESECASIIARAKPVFSKLASQIGQGKPFPEMPVSLGDRFISGPFNPLYYRKSGAGLFTELYEQRGANQRK